MPEYDAELITDYDEMKRWRDRFFASNGIQFLIVIGPPGSGKSRMFFDHRPTGTLYLSGALSAVRLYEKLYVHLDDPVVLDDVDEFFKDKPAVNLLKCLCNTDVKRTVYWANQNRSFEANDIPDQFTTTSRVCILANTLASVEANLAAVLDRALVVQFRPSVTAVHVEARAWVEDMEVYEFVGQHIPMIVEPSMRLYRKASDMKRVNLDWRLWLLRRWTAHDPKLRAVAQIMADTALQSVDQRLARFKELAGGSRATYMRK